MWSAVANTLEHDACSANLVPLSWKFQDAFDPTDNLIRFDHAASQINQLQLPVGVAVVPNFSN